LNNLRIKFPKTFKLHKTSSKPQTFIMSNTINKVKDALHINKDNTTTTGTTGTHTTTGAHTTGTHHTGTAEGVAGPHNSRVANAADPRIDSDLDNRRNAGVTGGGYSSTGTGVGTGHTGTGVGHGTTGTGYGTGTAGTTGTGYGTGPTGTGYSTSTNAGPHNSNVANKLDPRVDSDLDGSRNLGAASGTATTGHTTHGTTGHTTHGTSGLSGTHAGNTAGTHTGTTGGISHSTNAGPHNSNLANKADPRVDSDLDGRGNRHGAATGAGAGVFGASGSHATAGSGTAQNTAGPHNSDLLNKADPRVDSDRDGSKTFGGNKTHA